MRFMFLKLGGSKQQIENINLICANRNNLKDCLKDFYFDSIIDVCGYNQQDIKNYLRCSWGI